MALRQEIVLTLRQRARPRITVVRPGGLGDTLLVMPTLQLLLDELPGALVTLVGSVWAERLQPLIGLPVRLLRFDSALLTPLFSPSAATDPTGAFADAHAVVVYAAETGEILTSNARRFCAGAVIAWPSEPSGAEHASLHFAKAVTRPPLKPEELPFPSLRVPPDSDEWSGRWLAQRFPERQAVLALHPGSGGRHKCWPAECFARLAELTGRPILLLEGPADSEACAQVARLLPPEAPVARAAGHSVPEVAALVARCRSYVGNDSGLSHLAAALGVPAVLVFGPTDPKVWAPLGPNVQVVQVDKRGDHSWPSPERVARAVQASSG